MTNLNFKLLVNQYDFGHRELAEVAHFWNSKAIHYRIKIDDVISMILKLQLYYSKQDFYKFFFQIIDIYSCIQLLQNKAFNYSRIHQSKKGSKYLFFSFSIYRLTLACEYYRHVYFVHSRLQDKAYK